MKIIRSTARARRRDGYLYIAVLFTTLIVVAVVTASLSLSTSSTRSEIDRVNRMSAVRLAESELHRVAALIQTSSDWRTDSSNDVFGDWIEFGSESIFGSDAGQIRHRFTDTDGDLGDSLTDNVLLTAHARVGRSNAAVTVELEPRFDPLPILNYGVTATDDLELEDGARLSVELPVQVADDCKTGSSGALTTERLECSGNVEFSLRGDLAAADLDLPSHDVVAAYGDGATSISVYSLPYYFGMREIRNQVITPGNNPFGTENANGIYKIDARGWSIRIINCRLDATLVIENCPYVAIASAVSWNYPVEPDAILVTDAQVGFFNLYSHLSEPARATNFNPAGAPYGGVADTDLNDRYATQLGGLIYSTDTITFHATNAGQRLFVKGGIICRDLRVHCDLSVLSMNELIESTPPPLADPTRMQFVPGTHRRVTLP